jgi:hypothetical protein
MYDERDPRTIRLYDLQPFEAIVVACSCGHITEYPEGLLQRQYRLPSDTLIYDLQFRLRCQHCNKRREFRISILDRRNIVNSFAPRIECVIIDPKANGGS